jgi:hypothetical protein
VPIGDSHILIAETLSEADQPPLRPLEAGKAFREIAYVFQASALVILQQAMLCAVMSLTESAIADDPLRGISAILEGATRLLRGHVCVVWSGVETQVR